MLPQKNYYMSQTLDMYKDPSTKEKIYMKTDIYELENNYYLEIDIPGINKENIKITYENGYLTIFIKRTILSVKKESYIRKERFFGEMKRSFYIGIKKITDIKANHHNGLLIISFPKEDESKNPTKNITIS